jgi:2-dehydro-3-deoxyphosphogluconate aldolase / (4S)-4-hydroxy-2-oxoglutarate aldolase
MRSRAEIISLLEDPGIIVIFRADKPDYVVPACDALVAGGVNALEVTLTTPGALEVIRELCVKYAARAVIGAGSVLNAQMCRDAIDAGAEFIVTPVTKPGIVLTAHESGRAVMLGAYTPTEAQAAHEAGADFVKIFPADKLGPGYIKAIRAPLPHLKIVPTGGVDLKTAGDFLDAGCAALGVGSSLVSQEILKRGDWAELTRSAQAFVALVRAHRDRRANKATSAAL